MKPVIFYFHMVHVFVTVSFQIFLLVLVIMLVMLFGFGCIHLPITLVQHPMVYRFFHLRFKENHYIVLSTQYLTFILMVSPFENTMLVSISIVSCPMKVL